MEGRFLVNRQIKRIDLIDIRRDVRHRPHFERRQLLQLLEFAAQLGAHVAAEHVAQIIFDSREVADAAASSACSAPWQNRAPPDKRARPGPSCRELLEYDQFRLEAPRLLADAAGKASRDGGARRGVLRIEMAFASGAPDHQGSHLKETRPDAPERSDELLYFRAGRRQEDPGR